MDEYRMRFRTIEPHERIIHGDQYQTINHEWLTLEDDSSFINKTVTESGFYVRRLTDEEIVYQKQFVIRGMDVYGNGGFMSSLGLALTKADRSNTIKIYQTWHRDWSRYYEMGKSISKN